MLGSRFEDLMSQAEEISRRTKTELTLRREAFEETLRSLALTNYDKTKVNDFLSEPYAILPKGEDEWYVVVPRFIDLQVGWLERQTPSFNIFRVNRYIDC